MGTIQRAKSVRKRSAAMVTRNMRVPGFAGVGRGTQPGDLEHLVVTFRDHVASDLPQAQSQLLAEAKTQTAMPTAAMSSPKTL